MKSIFHSKLCGHCCSTPSSDCTSNQKHYIICGMTSKIRTKEQTYSQSSHGPFGSGHHQWTKQQTAELLAESMTTSDFENIRESMTRDRYGDTTDIPESPSDLPDIPSVANFPIFVAWSKLGSTLTSKSVSKTLHWK